MSVEKWLGSLRSKSTKKVYMAGLRDFARIIGIDIKRYAEHELFEDLLKYATSLTERNSPPKTANVYMLAVRNFLEFKFDFVLSRKQRRELRGRMPRGKRPRTIEDSLTREKIVKIINQCPLKGRALFLTLLSSSIRVGEALQLTLDNIDLESVPAKVNVRGEYTKTGDKYYSFISKEAQDVLEQWLKVREDYLKTAVTRGKGLIKHAKKEKLNDDRGKKSVEDDRIFPFSFQVASMMWNNALRKTGLENHDKSTNRRTLHIHMLRKFFNSQLKGEAKLPREIVDALMGHEEGLSVAYRRFTEEQIKKWYLKGEPYLSIFMPQEIREMREQYDKRLEDLQIIVNGLHAKNLKLEENVEQLYEVMESKIESVTARIQEEHFRKIFEENYGITIAELEEFCRMQRKKKEEKK